MADFSKNVLITDLDGTLLPHSKILNEKDLRAIEYFKANGGIFTVATGRILQATEQFFGDLKPNAPVIMNNGGLIYDTAEKKSVYSVFLDRAAVEYTKKMMEHFPEIGVEINTMDEIFVVRMSELERCHLDMTHLPYTEVSFEEVPKDGWCKVLFSIDPDKMHLLEEYTAKMGWDKTDFVASGAFLFECLPKGCTKGSALKKLAELQGWDNYTISAAGDYDNDLAMLEFADISFAPQNAKDNVKEAASCVTAATCNEGAIAEAIEYIEKECKVK